MASKRDKKFSMADKQQGAYDQLRNALQSAAKEAVKEAIKGGVEEGVEEGAATADVSGSVKKGIKKNKSAQKITMPIEVEFQPEAKIKDKKLASEQIKAFNKIQDKKRVSKYYVDKTTAENNLKSAYSSHESRLASGKKINPDVTRKEIGEIVRWGNAYVALGGNIDDLDKKLKKFYLDNAKNSNYNSKQYPFTVDKFKNAFNIMQGMLDNGFDMSSFKSNLVDVATDAAVEAVDAINKTVESKTKTKKIDNTKKIQTIQEELAKEEAKYEELNNKRNEITKQRIEKESELANQIIDEDFETIIGDIKEKNQKRYSEFKKRMEKTGFYRTESDGTRKRIGSFDPDAVKSDFAYHDQKVAAAQDQYIKTLFENIVEASPNPNKGFNSEQEALWYLRKEVKRRKSIKKIEQRRDSLTRNYTKAIRSHYGNVANGIWGDEVRESISPGSTKNPNDYLYNAIDFKNLKLYKAYSNKSAKEFDEFMQSMEQFCITAGSSFKGFEKNVEGLDIRALYNKFKSVFPDDKIEFSAFENFINNMTDLVKISGLKKDGSFNDSKLSKFKEQYGQDDIRTRFLKKLGYQGYDLTSVKYGQDGNGLVLFDDVRKDNVLLSTNSQSEIDNNISNIIKDKVEYLMRFMLGEIEGYFNGIKPPDFFTSKENREKIKEATRTRNKAERAGEQSSEDALLQFSDLVFNTKNKDTSFGKEILNMIGKLKYIYEQKGEELPDNMQLLLEELVGQLIQFEEDKTQNIDERKPMWKSDIKRELNRLHTLSQSDEVETDLVKSQISDAFGLSSSKKDIELQNKIYNILTNEKTTMDDIVVLSDELYLLEKQRSELTEVNSNNKNDVYQDFNEGYRSEKIRIEEKKDLTKEYKKQYSEVDKELKTSREKINTKRNELLEAEFEQLSSSITPQMERDEIEAALEKIKEIQSKAIEFGLDSGRDNIYDRVGALKEQLDQEIKAIEEKAVEMRNAAENYNDAKDTVDDEAKNKSKKGKGKKSKKTETDTVTTSSTEGVEEEAEAMQNLGTQAGDTAKSKEAFAEANEQVLSSIIESLKGLKDEGELFKYLDVVLEKLSDNDGVDELAKNLTKLRDILNSSIDENSFINSINQLTSNRKVLNDLATVLRASKGRIEETRKATVQQSENNNDTEEAVEKKNELAIANQKAAATADEVAASSQRESDALRELSNSISSSIDFEKFADTDLKNPAISYIDKFGYKFPVIVDNMKEVVDESVEVIDSLDKIAVAFNNNTEAVNKNNNAITQHKPIKYEHRIRQNPDGTLEDVSRSFTAKDELGNTKKYTRYSDGTVDATEVVRYTELVNQASKALIEAVDTQHKLNIEESKSNPDLIYRTELYTKLTNAIERYDEAVRVATGHHVDYRDFLNDPNVGSKYNIDTGFFDEVRSRTTAPLADMSARYRKQALDRTGAYKKRINSAENAIQFELDYGKHTDDFNTKLETLLQNLKSFDAITLFDEGNIERIERFLNEYKLYNKEGKLSANKLANENSVSKGLSQINSILSGNTKGSFKKTDVYTDLMLLQRAFKNFDTSRPQEELNVLMSKLLNTKARFEELGDTVKGKNFFETFVERLRGANAQLIAQYLSFQDIIRYARTLATTLIDLDTQLIDLRKTTSMNNQELDEFYHNSAGIAKQLGVTTSEIISQAAAWSRLGYNTKEQSEQMAALSSKFASISPGMGTDEAQTGLVSVMKAWKIDVVDVEREIMDNINVLGNNFAETNADIITGMEKAGATLSAIGTDYKDAFALFTGAQEVIQNAETVGTAMKTLSLRIRGYDEETEELSDDVINAMGKVADLTKVASNNFAGVSLWADAEQTKYRSLKEYLGDIAKIWSEISAGNQTELLEKLFGKRGASVGSAILGNFEQVEKAIEQMEGAAGSADREMGIIRDSMEFKLNAIKQEWVETLTTVTDSGDLKSLLDFILKVSEGLGDIVTNIGLIKTLVIGVSTVIGSKKLGIFNTQDSGTLIGALIQKHQKNKEISDYKAVLNGYQNRKDALLNADFSQAQDMTDNVKKSIGDIQQKVRDAKGTGDEVFTHIQYQMEATAGKTTKLGNSIKTFFKGALNGLVSMVASAAISFAIDAVIKKLDKEIITAKEAAAMTAQFNDSFAAMQKEQIETSKVIGELDEEFQRLSKGVNSLGHNVSLTEDEFKRYNEITSIIAEKAPNLVKGYTEQGDAIINLTGGVNTLTEAYKEMQEQQARTEYNKLDSDGSRITKGVFENTQNVIDDYEKRYRDLNETRETILKLIQLDAKEFNELMDQIAKGDENGNYNTELEDLVVQAGYTGDASDNYEELHKNLIQVYKDTESEFREYEANLKSATKDIAQAGQLYVHGITTYWKDLDDSQRNLLDTFMSQIDNLEDIGIIADKLGYNITDEQGMKDFVTQLVGMISKLSSDDLNQIETKFNVETLFNNNELSYNEYLTQLQDLETWLSELPEEQQSIIRILFNISDTDEAGNDIKNAIIDARKNAGTYNKTSYEKSDRDKEVDQWLGTLNNEDLNIVANLTLNGDELVPELQQLLAEAKRMAEANSIEVKVKASDAVDSMADAKTAITSINELWEQTVQNNLALKKDKKFLDEDGNVLKQYDSQNMAAGFADPEKINAAESAFKSFIQTASDSGKDVTQMNIALEEFEKTLVEQPGDAEAAQKAIDNLITAYIDQTDIIKNLDEANAEWSIAQLEAYGVTNAEQVVMSRLNTTVKKLAKQFEIAADSIKALNTEMKGSANWNTSMENVQSSLNEMFKTDLGNGEFMTPNFDEAWIVQNLDLITEAASGSYDAIYKVQKAAAQRIAMQVDINMPNQSAINGTLNYINQLINDFPIDDIEVGTSLDTNPMIQGLNALVDAGTITRDSMNAILASIGVEPDITYEDVPVSMFSSASEMLKAAGFSPTSGDPQVQAMARAFNGGLMGTVRVPKIGYKMANKGVGAQYASPSGGGSSGGGGGGGGGGSSSEPTKPKEEAEESFDWIEVAIQRIEEEIARLDKVVGNSYDFWVKRNEALLKEIDKTKDEIKAQQTAYSEYLRNANAVQVNHGKGLNADDYGENDSLVKAQDERLLAEAKKAWATGEYQKKVQEGLMTGKDIETIQNHFLADTIKTYQELYNKAISAQDAVQDLKIKLGDLARTNFDHVKGEAEDAIAYFESYADLINARIERTEEKGYFATKTFQGALISYEQERLKVLKKEYDELIAKRDEATRTKAILPYSEEFNKMNQEILEVGKSIEEATTNLVKFNNEMRQHDWDVFDFTQERINNIAEEFDFLIDLLDNQKLYDDYGLFNSRGWADSALHAGKYNAYMEQALQYAKEREKIEADLKKDNADKNLIERREELIKLQQESITNAYAEKEAVKSLVEEGKYFALIKFV